MNEQTYCSTYMYLFLEGLKRSHEQMIEDKLACERKIGHRQNWHAEKSILEEIKPNTYLIQKGGVYCGS